jgi:hypothetical protein
MLLCSSRTTLDSSLKPLVTEPRISPLLRMYRFSNGILPPQFGFELLASGKR